MLTAKRGEWALEEPDVRREAWYALVEEWENASEGEGGAEIVGDEVSMSRPPVVVVMASF